MAALVTFISTRRRKRTADKKRARERVAEEETLEEADGSAFFSLLNGTQQTK